MPEEKIHYEKPKELREIEAKEDKLMQKRAKHAHERRKRIHSFKAQGGIALINLGKELYEAKENEDHEPLGFDSWAALVVADTESGGYGLMLDTATKLRRVYEHYVIGQIATLQELKKVAEPFKLYEARKHINRKERWSDISLPLSQIKIKGTAADRVECNHVWRKCWKCQICKHITYHDPFK